jgi:hypothetical protein
MFKMGGTQKKLSTKIKVPRPKAKVEGLSLFPRTPTTRSNKKSALQDDPMKFGSFGFDINQLSPLDVSRGAK